MVDDPKVYLRSAQSGPIVKGTDANVLTADGGKWGGEPPAGGSTIAPIQNVRYYDATFAGTPDGSIAAPFTTIADFDALAIGNSEGWVLELPAVPVTVDSALSNYNDSPTIVFNGQDRRATVLDTLEVGSQNGPINFTARNLTVDALSIGAQSGSAEFLFDNVEIGEFSGFGGTIQGTYRFLNCDVTDFTPGDFGPAAVVQGGTVRGLFTTENATFDGVEIANGATLRFGAHHVRFLGTKFGTGVTILNNNNPVLELDPESYYWFRTNSVTYAGALLFTPVVPIIGHVTNSDEDSIAGGGASTLDFGNPVGGPLAEPGSRIVGCFASDPGGVGLALQGLSVDAGTGHVMARIVNNTANTITLASNVDINIVYEPRHNP